MGRDHRKRSIWSFRRPLLKVHEDLLKIHRCVDPYAKYYPDRLTELERLVIVLEDRKFFDHKGIHFKAIVREFARTLMFKRAHGASTIDMQFVRTATGYRKRSIRRKSYEIFLAALIQYRYSKLTILRSYLSIAYLGWTLKGMEETSRIEFNQYYTDIHGLDAAKLAAYLVYPKPKVPNEKWEKKVLRRANYINGIYISREKHFKKLERSVFS